MVSELEEKRGPVQDDINIYTAEEILLLWV